ncbi:MAG: hypothetical protein E7253_09265 [Lachnospiraceae bacterium]|nr:hypothetical protein [Lachnospiraceae bacterium]
MKKKKMKRSSKQNKLQTRIVVTIVLVVFIAIGVNTYSTYLKYQDMKAQEAELDLAIAEAEAEKAALLAKEEYMKTDDFVKDMAREEFGMVEPDEYILKSNTEDN